LVVTPFRGWWRMGSTRTCAARGRWQWSQAKTGTV
jgi:hypothetical protein